MRKLAPMFVMTSIVALVGGNAVANMNDKTAATTPSATTDSAASPTVPATMKGRRRPPVPDETLLVEAVKVDEEGAEFRSYLDGSRHRVRSRRAA